LVKDFRGWEIRIYKWFLLVFESSVSRNNFWLRISRPQKLWSNFTRNHYCNKICLSVRNKACTVCAMIPAIESCNPTWPDLPTGASWRASGRVQISFRNILEFYQFILFHNLLVFSLLLIPASSTASERMFNQDLLHSSMFLRNFWVVL
jgi:hypothetical protein